MVSVRRFRSLLPALAMAGALALLWTCRREGEPPAEAPQAPAPASQVATPAAQGGGTLNGNVPLAVAGLTPGLTPDQARPFFDAFSWQSFIALNWPADTSAIPGTPLQPDDSSVFLSASSGAQPVVWGTYKEDFELFDQGSNRPPAWTSPATPANPCGGASLQPGQKVFTKVTKGDDLVQIGNQAFSYPLIDQNQNYAMYEILFNQAQYEFIRGSDSDPGSWLYLAKNLAAKEPITMPASAPPSTQGALMVKAAWKMIAGNDQPGRFYVVDALVYDPATKKCSPQKAGLVGLHIVQKLADFPEWIWSTFEQVDNVPGSASGPFSFNNGTDSPPTVNGYADRPPSPAPKLQPKAERKPVQVSRYNAIPASTVELNKQYQATVKGTVWQYYQLVFTQWPADPKSFTTMEAGGLYPQDSGGAFPANGVTNTVMETYFQAQSDASGAGGNSCMSCHYRAGQADYSWTLMRSAH